MTSVEDVRKHVDVQIGPDEAFELFTRHPSSWWPPHHVQVDRPRVGLCFEPHVGGRYFEWNVNGDEFTWGTISDFEPGRRLRMSWRLGAGFAPLEHDDCSEIEVLFDGQDGLTRVTLVHTSFGRLGEDGAALRLHLDGPSPGDTLRLFALAANKAGRALKLASTDAAAKR